MAGEDIYGSPEHQAFRAGARKFIQTELAPRAREFDEAGRAGKGRCRGPREGGRARSARPDRGATKTRAVRAGDWWVINRSKMFTPPPATGGWHRLLGVTDPGAGY